VVSGAVLEEGRAGGAGKGWTGLRGGWRGSVDSVAKEKEALYNGGKVPWHKDKKKLRESFPGGEGEMGKWV
jgi:hypothetical protein